MSNIKKALIIEDSEEVVEAVTLALQIRWPEAIVTYTDRGTEGLKLVEKEKPDVVILDLGLPDINGFEVLKRLRVLSNVPVIILTVRKDEGDIVKGLELGADDYIIKPFRQMELLSRVNAQLRKSNKTVEESPIVCGRLRIDLYAHILYFNERQINLTPIESMILGTLMRNAGTVVSHSSLAREVWDDYYPGASRSLKVHIRRLREKMEVDPSNPELILTKANAGYYLTKTE